MAPKQRGKSHVKITEVCTLRQDAQWRREGERGRKGERKGLGFRGQAPRAGAAAIMVAIKLSLSGLGARERVWGEGNEGK